MSKLHVQLASAAGNQLRKLPGPSRWMASFARKCWALACLIGALLGAGEVEAARAPPNARSAALTGSVRQAKVDAWGALGPVW